MTHLPPTSPLHLQLLGSFRVTRNGADLTPGLSQPKRIALLAWLALSRPAGLHRRDTLCALLWPDSPDEKARGSLRQLLVTLRRELGEAALILEGDLVGIDEALVSSDATAVLAALEAGDDVRAVDLYAGELLPGLHLGEGEAFERWFEQQRSTLRAGVLRAAWRLVDRSETSGDLSLARARAERAHGIDPDDEAGLRRAMGIQARSGDRASALRTYETFKRHLLADWGTTPEPATQMLAERIREGGLDNGASAPPPTESTALVPDSTLAGQAVPDHTRQGMPAHNKPRLVRGSVVALVASAVLLLGFVATRPEPVTAADRVLVVPFQNLTGDPSLAAIGTLAADWVIQGLQRTGKVEVVDPATAFISTREQSDKNPQSISKLRDLAHPTGARLLVVGAVATVQDSLEYTARLVDLQSGRILRVLDPMRTPRQDPTRPLNELRSRLGGAVAIELDEPMIPVSRGESPPRIEAYEEFIAGLAEFVASKNTQGRARFEEAIRRDSTFTLARIWLFYALANNDLDDSAAAVVRRIRRDRDAQVPVVLAWLEIDSLEAARAELEVRVAAYERATRLSPGSHNEWNLANQYISQGRPRAAIEIYRRFRQQESWFIRWGSYWQRRGDAYHLVGDHRGEADIRTNLASELTPFLLTRAAAALGDLRGVRQVLDSALLSPASNIADPRIGVTIYIAAMELEAHGHEPYAVSLLEWGDSLLQARASVFHARASGDSITRLLVDRAILRALLASYRSDRNLAREARETLESLFPVLASSNVLLPGSETNALYFWHLSVCTEGDSARIARLPVDYVDFPAVRLMCIGDHEGAIRELRTTGHSYNDHLFPHLRPLRPDPRFQAWLRPTG